MARLVSRDELLQAFIAAISCVIFKASAIENFASEETRMVTRTGQKEVENPHALSPTLARRRNRAAVGFAPGADFDLCPDAAGEAIYGYSTT